MKTKPLKTVKASSPVLPARMAGSADLRDAIARAESGGVKKKDMLLRLTLRDESALKRDPQVGLDEISFTGGVMRFLGVKVNTAEGGTSALEAPVGTIHP